ncbi:MAG TPA: fluoride efflux transporter CrcB [Kofleriaceae bacterium]|jgi:CrcB protein|nr:fluoride efflux transporter CrcB [Kofleriaceae bacterium]
MDRVTGLLMVCLGGALGSGLRYLTALWTAARGWTAFPWATLIVNVIGCFLIMLIVTIASATTMSPGMRLFLTTGMMGGLTTYSTFDYETTRFFQDGLPASALANIGATLVACFVAGLLGLALARLIVPAAAN